jgi:hypothetical protein
MAGGIFFFSCFPYSYGSSVTSRTSDVVSPGDWLVSGIWFLLSTGRLQLRPKVTHCQFLQVVQSCCYFQQVAAVALQLQLSNQFLPQPGGAIQFLVLPSVS